MQKFQAHTTKLQKNAAPVRSQEAAFQNQRGPVQSMTPQATDCGAQVSRDGLTPVELLALQRTVGNRQVQRLLERHTATSNDRHSGMLIGNPGHKVQTRSFASHGIASTYVPSAIGQLSSLTGLGKRVQRQETTVENKPSEAISLTFGKNANADAVSDYSKKVLEDILSTAGLQSATITSTARTPADQARAMYNNLEANGVAHQKALYGANGDQVIDVYATLKQEKKSADEIKVAMTVKINELGPSKVSNHCADPSIINVVDIAPNSITDQKGFEKAVAANSQVGKFLKPPADPAYHLEIPQMLKTASAQTAPSEPATAPPAKTAFKTRKYALSKELVKVIKENAKLKMAEVQEAPATFATAILDMAGLDAERWFDNFTDVTFLGRKLNAPIHIELAAHLQTVEKKFAQKYGGEHKDPKVAGDQLGLSASEPIKGGRKSPTSAPLSMHLFGLAIDLNYTANPFISSSANPVFARAGLLVNGEKMGFTKNMSYTELAALDRTLETYFAYLNAPADLQAQLTRATDGIWKGIALKQAQALIKADLNLVAKKWQRSGTSQKEIIKQGGFLDLKQKLVEGMGLHWGAAYGDIMHFDMRNKGDGAEIHKAIAAYKAEKEEEAKQKWQQEHS